MRPTGMPLLTLRMAAPGRREPRRSPFRRTRFSISGTSKSSAEIFPPSTLSKNTKLLRCRRCFRGAVHLYGLGGAVRRCHRFYFEANERAVPRNVHSAMGFGKIDWNPSDRNTFSFDANVMHWVSSSWHSDSKLCSPRKRVGQQWKSQPSKPATVKRRGHES